MQQSEWQPIETAPKDGTRVMLWRDPTDVGEWAEIVFAEWHEGYWMWPDPRTISTVVGAWPVDDLMDGYADDQNFTYWQPLPPAPEAQP